MPVAVVNKFIAAWSALDFAAIASAVSDDIFYQNIPYAAVAHVDELPAFSAAVSSMVNAGPGGMPITPIIGRRAFVDFLETIKAFDWADWTINAIAAAGPQVFTDRLDAFGITGGLTIKVGVVGVFTVTDGLISEWRDYFSLQEFQSQLGSALS
jgi:limonene-1,2-epoxide hydrolase